MFRVTKINHIGIVVPDMAPGMALFQELLGLPLVHEEFIAKPAHQSNWLQVGDSIVELLQPAEEDAMIHRFLQERGAGLHHLALQVDSLDAACADLQARGIGFAVPPRPGRQGTRIAFLDPAQTMGFLIELVEVAGPDASRT